MRETAGLRVGGALRRVYAQDVLIAEMGGVRKYFGVFDEDGVTV